MIQLFLVQGMGNYIIHAFHMDHIQYMNQVFYQFVALSQNIIDVGFLPDILQEASRSSVYMKGHEACRNISADFTHGSPHIKA